MVSSNPLKNSFQFIFLKIAGDILYFPLWWYSKGFLKLLKKISLSLKSTERSLSLKLWIKNIFSPMYGMSDIWSRVISFFIRLVMLFYKTLVYLGWFFICFAFLVLYLLWPVFLAFMFIRIFV